jgi:hypothetical protein
MDNSMMNMWPVDPGLIIVGLAVVCIILMVCVIICMIQMKKLYRRYDYFMRGKDAETLEEIIMEAVDDVAALKAEDRSNKDAIRNTNKNYRRSLQKLGIIKYNAFKGMGGNLSFAVALLDYTNTGFVLNSVHSREGCYVYIKEVERGETDVLLGSEERDALEQALGYHS